MNKIIVCILAGLVLAGCENKQSADNQAADAGTQKKAEARKLTAEAAALLAQKDYQHAIAALDAAIKLDPSDQDPYLILGQLLLKAGEYNRAVEFLDNAAKNFPDNGMIFYMLSISNRMAGKKLPAVLAARRSYEIFKNANDQENTQRSAILLEQVINSPDPAANAIATTNNAGNVVNNAASIPATLKAK